MKALMSIIARHFPVVLAPYIAAFTLNSIMDKMP